MQAHEHVEVVVIGGGQAGLAIGYYLAQQQRRFVILDSSPAVGHSWRTRYDSLRVVATYLIRKENPNISILLHRQCHRLCQIESIHKAAG